MPYLDHNATSPLRPEVRAAFLEALDRVDGMIVALPAVALLGRIRGWA